MRCGSEGRVVWLSEAEGSRNHALQPADSTSAHPHPSASDRPVPVINHANKGLCFRFALILCSKVCICRRCSSLLAGAISGKSPAIFSPEIPARCIT